MLLQHYDIISIAVLPAGVHVNSDVVGVIIVVCLLSLDFIIAGSYYNVPFIQKYLADAFLSPDQIRIGVNTTQESTMKMTRRKTSFVILLK